MPRRRLKKNTKKTEPKEPQIQMEQPHFMDLEIKAMERQIDAIRAVREVKIEQLLTDLQLLRSCFSEEELQKPVLETFDKTLQNLSIVNDKESKKFELVWKDKESMNMNCGDVHASLLQRLSMAYPYYSSSIPPFAGRTSFIGAADNPYLKDFVLEEPSESQTLAMQEGLQTPGVNSQRLSVGMTPKTLRVSGGGPLGHGPPNMFFLAPPLLRVPKPGEMLLSVHGSPLGVYKDNNMEAIHESEEG